jgi:hypothetical protein
VGSAVLEPYSAFSALGQMQTRDGGQRILRRAFKDLERELPGRVAWVIRNLRHPDAKWVVNDRTVVVNPRTRQIVEIVE